MPTKRYGTSSVSTRSPEVLVVVGGKRHGKKLDVVEVLKDNKWTTVDPLPEPHLVMCSALHDGNLYYFIERTYQHATMYTCSCASLISSCEKPSSHTSNSQLWRELEVLCNKSAIMSHSLRLVNIDGRGTVSCYSSTRDSWIEVTSEGDRPRHYSSFIAACTLPTGDIVFAHYDYGIYRVTVLGEYVHA